MSLGRQLADFQWILSCLENDRAMGNVLLGLHTHDFQHGQELQNYFLNAEREASSNFHHRS